MRVALLSLALVAVACSGDEGSAEVGSSARTPANVRALRRAYDGAPPVTPHANFGVGCTSCHDRKGMEVEGVGFAPPSPHGLEAEAGSMMRCRQCHVEVVTDDVLVASSFAGFAQDLRRGERQHAMAPPVVPHRIFMRENCQACHTGPAAREEIRTTHPERDRCTQCHVPTKTDDVFRRP